MINRQKIQFLYIFFLFFATLLYSEDLKTLLSEYKQASDLSKITKIDSAGPVQIFTRDDLEKMQVHNLSDVINSLSGIYLQRSSSNSITFARATTPQISTTYTRLYINDHDMSSSFFGSGFFIWGEMPIEYIDHIEVYTSSSSLAFGNENGSVIFRLYTKTAQRDSGSKVRIISDNKGSSSLNFYTANILENDLSYFTYANIENIKRKVYHNNYNNHIYDFKSNKQGYNIFANLAYQDYSLDVGLYKKDTDNFIGLSNFMGASLHDTPTDGYFNSKHNYFHLTKKFDNKIKFQLSFDDIRTQREYTDPNGIQITNDTLPLVVDNYNISLEERILSVVLEKKLKIKNHNLFFGSFYKHKAFTYNSDFSNISSDLTSDFSNRLNLYSLYAEDAININDTLRFTASLKGDFYRYKKDVKSQNAYLTRIGFVKSINRFKYKFFYSRNYVELGIYQIYNPTSTPYKANPDLDSLHPDIYTSSIEYTTNKLESSLEISQARNKKAWVYDPRTAYGWSTITYTMIRTMYRLNNTYKIDRNNKIVTNIVYGNTSQGLNDTPPFEIMLKSFNTYNKFDFYNAFVFRTSYTSYDINIGASYDLTSSIKYHYTQDLSFGLRGENILNKAYQQAYNNLDYTIPVVDQKVWFNLEYLF